MSGLHLSRRSFGLGAAAAAFLRTPASAAGARDPRLVVLVLRGALDGLAAVAPVGDPAYAELHGAIALTRPGGERAGAPLDDFFALNPALANFHRMFQEKRGLVVHATATPYRDRSHFDGQDVLESGMPKPGHVESGWLNRALAALPGAGRSERGLAVGAAAPLILRGSAPVMGWTPQVLPDPGEALAARALDLYTHADPALAAALARGLDADRLAARRDGDGAMRKPGGAMDNAQGMAKAAVGAARLLAAPDGPRLAALAFDGFDTHANEGAVQGQIAARLSGLDAAFAGFEKELGPAWRETIVVAITEFGRTARVNGASGTDHGVGSVAFLAGGAVAGGRVVADWPGLGPKQLYEGRDLAASTDLRAVLKGVLADHLGLGATALAEKIFPGSLAVAPMKGLVAA